MAPVSPLAPHGATTRIGKSGSGHFPRQPKIPERDQEFGDSAYSSTASGTGARTGRWTGAYATAACKVRLASRTSTTARRDGRLGDRGRIRRLLPCPRRRRQQQQSQRDTQKNCTLAHRCTNSLVRSEERRVG